MYANVICGGIHNTSQVIFLTQTKGNLSPYTENRRMIAIQQFSWCKHVGPMKSKHQERLIISSWKIKPTEDEVGKNWDSNHWLIWTHGSLISIEISSQKSSYPLEN